MKRLMTLAVGLAMAGSVSATTFCNGGFIQQVADITYSAEDLYDWAASNLPSPPPAVVNLDFWIASNAVAQACNVYAGWSGPTFGVIGAGSVVPQVYAPSSYGSGNGYSINQGAAFKCLKCLPHPVLRPVDPRR